MKISRITLAFSFALFLNSLNVCAKTVKDTLTTSDNDRIILTYEISHSDNCYTIKFNRNPQKKLGQRNGKTYKDWEKVAVMFFDRRGGFTDDVSITNMAPEPFMVPANVDYKQSSEGFFIVQDSPELVFHVNGLSDITIPIYLAYHPKKGKYTLFSKSSGMKIHLSTSSSATTNRGYSQTIQQDQFSTIEVEADNTDLLQRSIKRTKELLNEADKLPFSEDLEDEISFIKRKEREITDEALLSQISDVLQMCRNKKRALEDQMSAIQQEAETKAKREAEELQAKNDSAMIAQQEQAAKDQSRNLWMYIGGIVTVILAFIGNQILQSRRNKKNQQDTMKLQQSIADKAEAEAKRRAEEGIRNTAKQTSRQYKGKTHKPVHRKTIIKINGKYKDSSI